MEEETVERNERDSENNYEPCGESFFLWCILCLQPLKAVHIEPTAGTNCFNYNGRE